MQLLKKLRKLSLNHSLNFNSNLSWLRKLDNLQKIGLGPSLIFHGVLFLIIFLGSLFFNTDFYISNTASSETYHANIQKNLTDSALQATVYSSSDLFKGQLDGRNVETHKITTKLATVEILKKNQHQYQHAAQVRHHKKIKHLQVHHKISHEIDAKSKQHQFSKLELKRLQAQAEKILQASNPSSNTSSNQNQNQNQNQNNAAEQSEKNNYLSLLGQIIKSHWINQYAGQNLEVNLNITQDDTGEVLSVTIAKSSGNGGFDQSAVLAVQKSSPLPLPQESFLLNNTRQMVLAFS